MSFWQKTRGFAPGTECSSSRIFCSLPKKERDLAAAKEVRNRGKRVVVSFMLKLACVEVPEKSQVVA